MTSLKLCNGKRCDVCHKLYAPKPYRMKSSRFCSVACKHIGLRAKIGPERIKCCEVCLKGYVPRHPSKMKTARFCSKKCQMYAMGKESYRALQKTWEQSSFKEAVEMALFIYVEKTPTCWNWIGKSTSSKLPYGRISFRGKTWQAHRLSYSAHKGEIPPGKLVLHHCDNPACVNPEHLYLGTYQDNQNDKRKRNRCVGEKLSEEQVRKIKEELTLHAQQKSRKGPYSLLQIGKRFNISRTMVKQIQEGKSWSWLGVGA